MLPGIKYTCTHLKNTPRKHVENISRLPGLTRFLRQPGAGKPAAARFLPPCARRPPSCCTVHVLHVLPDRYNDGITDVGPPQHAVGPCPARGAVGQRKLQTHEATWESCICEKKKMPPVLLPLKKNAHTLFAVAQRKHVIVHHFDGGCGAPITTPRRPFARSLTLTSHFTFCCRQGTGASFYQDMSTVLTHGSTPCKAPLETWEMRRDKLGCVPWP